MVILSQLRASTKFRTKFGCFLVWRTGAIIQEIEKTLNNSHTTTQKWTNNGFRNTKKHANFHMHGTTLKILQISVNFELWPLLGEKGFQYHVSISLSNGLHFKHSRAGEHSIAIRQFKQRRFWDMRVNRKWTFCTLEPWFSTTLWANHLYKGNDSQQYKFGSVKQFKVEKGSLPVDVRHSKTSLLKHPNMALDTLERLGSIRDQEGRGFVRKDERGSSPDLVVFPVTCK